MICEENSLWKATFCEDPAKDFTVKFPYIAEVIISIKCLGAQMKNKMIQEMDMVKSIGSQYILAKVFTGN